MMNFISIQPTLWRLFLCFKYFTVYVLVEHVQHPYSPIVWLNGWHTVCMPIYDSAHYRYLLNKENALHVNSYAQHLLTAIPFVLWSICLYKYSIWREEINITKSVQNLVIKTKVSLRKLAMTIFDWTLRIRCIWSRISSWIFRVTCWVYWQWFVRLQ